MSIYLPVNGIQAVYRVYSSSFPMELLIIQGIFHSRDRHVELQDKEKKN